MKIMCYSGEHPPPHVHVLCSEFEILIELENIGIYSGYMPLKKLSRAKQIIQEHQADLLFLFNELNPHLRRKP